jgi:hypothetical protein
MLFWPPASNPGDLQFLRAQLLQPLQSDGRTTNALILHAGGCQFGPRAIRPRPRAETLEKLQGLTERLACSNRTAIAAQRLPEGQERTRIFERDPAYHL